MPARVLRLEGGVAPVLLNTTDAETLQFHVDGPGWVKLQRGDGAAPAAAPAAGSVPFPVASGFGASPRPLDEIMLGTGARLWVSADVDTTVRVSWTEPS